MKLVKILLICFFAGLILNSCKKDTTTVALVGNWINRYDIVGHARSEGVAFAIGTKGYVGLGYDGKTRVTDFWAFDTTTSSWTEIAKFPGDGRTSATAFTVNGKGYVATGNNGGLTYLNDTWEYDPQANKWTQKAHLADSSINGELILGGRYEAFSFGFNDKGYLGAGYDGNYLNDFWRFNPAEGDSGRWHMIGGIGGSKRTGATAFVINEIGYLCCGLNNGQYVVDFWSFNPANEKWIELRKINNSSTLSYDDAYVITREYGVAFVINSKAYVTCGINSSMLTDTWEYDPITDLWTKKTAFEGSARYGAVAFSIGNRGFVATGRSGSNYRFSDFWEFMPNGTYNAND